MSAFYLNISSMSHFDDLNTLLSLLKCNFSFISITETRMLRDQESFLDFSMPGYSKVSTPTESTAGGVMLYISNCFAFKPRHDLDACLYLPRLHASVFVEIVLPNKPNIIIGVIYRHLCHSNLSILNTSNLSSISSHLRTNSLSCLMTLMWICWKSRVILSRQHFLMPSALICYCHRSYFQQ